MSWDPLLEVMEAQNVWDSWAQFGVMVLVAKSHSTKTGYASLSYNRIARAGGCNRRYAMILMEELELEKEALQNIGPDPGQGRKNRYVLTLDRAIAKVRAEAGVGPEVPLWKLPPRRARKRQGGPLVIQGSPSVITATAADTSQTWSDGDPGSPSMVIQAHHHGDPCITNGAGRKEDRFACTKNQGGAADAAAPPPNQPQFHLFGEAKPGQPHGAAVKRSREARESKLYHRVAGQARWILRHPTEGAALLKGDAVNSEVNLVDATKALCGQKRIRGYELVVHRACASEWTKFTLNIGARGSRA